MPRIKGTGKRGTRNLNGMGNIYYNEKTKRYEYRRMQDGELRFISAKTAGDLKEKIRAAGELPASNEKVKLYDWAEKWLTVYVEPFKKTSTYEHYRYAWEHYIKPNIKNVYITSVRPADLKTVIAKLNKQGMSKSTMKNVKKVLRIMFAVAMSDDEKLIAKNPAEKLDIPDVQQKTRKVLKVDEIRAIFECLENSRWYWVLRFMLVTGLRRGELLALKWSDIDFKEKVITVEDNNTYYGIGSTKSNKVHYVPLPKLAIECLNEFKKQLQNENNPAVWKNDSDIIFVSQQGTPMRPNSFYNVFRRIKEKTGIEIYPHSMRHTYVYYSKNKLSLSELKDALGHEESTSTLDIYGNLISDTKVVADKVDDAFDGVIDGEPKAVNESKVINLADRRKKY